MIQCLYGKKFIHNLTINYDGESYHLRLYVHDNKWCPILMSMQTDSEDTFINYICKELSSR